MLFWLILATIVTLVAIFKPADLSSKLMSAVISAICYIGIFLFVTMTFARSLKKETAL
ncbi:MULTISPECIES: hypothetical protein [Alteromonadaceae]|uniref:hypothetical protein n=1 Tax=Alteromonadaceae TaxID=72275 RepID=UPI001C08EF51|nr:MULTISPECIES: hypothetical protein [Aliiglaciecola]MBU2880064.1 hypothetical protein [Aliiglaciecola lipolytica]MDO6710938.1 hypothetical protein [Aliiglaciecola sp. 2_MG-2023]MDO6752419.1 hypothetical protein [Aliiglaciecola sp. 1_MG-2023]